MASREPHGPSRAKRGEARRAQRGWRGAIACGSLLAGFGGCESSPEVRVRVEVRNNAPGGGRSADVERVVEVAQAAIVRDEKVSGHARPAVASTDTIVDPPASPAALEQLIAALRTGAIDELAGPTGRLAQAPSHLWPEIRQELLRATRGKKGDFASLLSYIGGDVPNRYGTFELHRQKALGHAVRVSEDWLGDLVALESSRISRVLHLVYREALIKTALLRASVAAGRDPNHTRDVIATLLEVAYLQEGTFRDEVGRAIRAIGDGGVPALVAASTPPPDAERHPERPAARKAAYAEVQLDQLQRAVARQAAAAVQGDARTLTALLEAYGVRRPPDAASVLVEHAVHPTPSVRRAARTSLLAYVEGPAPRLQTRTLRLLGGQTETRSLVSYRRRAEQVLEQALQARAPDRVIEPCEPARADGSPDPNCATRPARLAHAYLGILDDARRAAEDEAIAAALAEPSLEARVRALDVWLAQDPEPASPQKIAPVFLEAATASEGQGDLRHAAQLLRKAAALLVASPEAAAIRLRAEALENQRIAAPEQATPEPSASTVALAIALGWTGILGIAWQGHVFRRRRPQWGESGESSRLG